MATSHPENIKISDAGFSCKRWNSSWSLDERSVLEGAESTPYRGSLDTNLPLFHATFPFNAACEASPALRRPLPSNGGHLRSDFLTFCAKMRSALPGEFSSRASSSQHMKGLDGGSADVIWTAVRRTFQDQEQLRRASEPRSLLRVPASSSELR